MNNATMLKILLADRCTYHEAKKFIARGDVRIYELHEWIEQVANDLRDRNISLEDAQERLKVAADSLELFNLGTIVRRTVDGIPYIIEYFV